MRKGLIEEMREIAGILQWTRINTVDGRNPPNEDARRGGELLLEAARELEKKPGNEWWRRRD